MNNLVVVNNPLVGHNLTIIRDEKTTYSEFRLALDRIVSSLLIALSENFDIENKEIHTPLEKIQSPVISNDIIAVPILRAGLGMMNTFTIMMPQVKVGFIGLKRNEETLQPEEYYFKIPEIKDNSICIVVDPMLATGGSAARAIDYLKVNGAKKIIFCSLIAAPEGVERLESLHSDVKIYTAALDRQLNDVGYILPGLGDAGDRIFGTV